jgi:hypothetical protein
MVEGRRSPRQFQPDLLPPISGDTDDRPPDMLYGRTDDEITLDEIDWVVI